MKKCDVRGGRAVIYGKGDAWHVRLLGEDGMWTLATADGPVPREKARRIVLRFLRSGAY